MLYVISDFSFRFQHLGQDCSPEVADEDDYEEGGCDDLSDLLSELQSQVSEAPSTAPDAPPTPDAAVRDAGPEECRRPAAPEVLAAELIASEMPPPPEPPIDLRSPEGAIQEPIQVCDEDSARALELMPTNPEPPATNPKPAKTTFQPEASPSGFNLSCHTYLQRCFSRLFCIAIAKAPSLTWPLRQRDSGKNEALANPEEED